MAEYIDKEQLLSDLYSKQDDENLDVMLEIANFPAADVAPVVHGKWEVVKVYGKTALYRCTACKAEMIDYMGREEYHQYCHICGAKTDGEKKEDSHE